MSTVAKAQPLEVQLSTLLELHLRRRFAMRLQQKLDRALEAYVRTAYTGYCKAFQISDKKKRKAMLERCSKEGRAMLKAARAVIKKARAAAKKQAPKSPEKRAEIFRQLLRSSGNEIVGFVADSDQARAPADLTRNNMEKAMEKLAKELPAYDLVKRIKGLGAGGFATIVAEATGSGLNGPSDKLALAGYATPDKVWKRFGYAPYQGLAMSTWRRKSWRPHALSEDEWIANPFAPERYAMVFAIVDSLMKAQLKGKTKTNTGMSEPKGPYGEVYCRRYQHTLSTHPDWSAKHRDMDAKRIVGKRLLKDFWRAWWRALLEVPETAKDLVPATSLASSPSGDAGVGHTACASKANRAVPAPDSPALRKPSGRRPEGKPARVRGKKLVPA